MIEYLCHGCRSYSRGDESSVPTQCPLCGHDDLTKITVVTGPVWLNVLMDRLVGPNRIRLSAVTIGALGAIFGLIVGYPSSYAFQSAALQETTSFPRYLIHIRELFNPAIRDVFNTQRSLKTAAVVWAGITAVCALGLAITCIVMRARARARQDANPEPATGNTQGA
jgi:hypothetical protein